jgi:hypothetical protein
MTRRDFDQEDNFQDWILDDNFEGFVETIKGAEPNDEPTDEPTVRAYRLSAGIVYQHPWSYFPQWHFMRDSVRDFLLWRPRDDTNSIALLALLYPLWALFFLLFFFVAVPLGIQVCLLTTPFYLIGGVLGGLKLSKEDLPRRREYTPLLGDNFRVGSVAGPTLGEMEEEEEEGEKGKLSALFFLMAITLGFISMGLMQIIWTYLAPPNTSEVLFWIVLILTVVSFVGVIVDTVSWVMKKSRSN